ncbi:MULTISPECIES: hypothetical protein [Cupriavidus]
MLKTILLALSAAVLVGCATADLSLDAPFVLKDDESLVLVAARIRNTREPKYPLVSFGADFARTGLSGGTRSVATGLADSPTFLIASKIKAGDNEMTWLTGATGATTAIFPGNVNFGVSAPFKALPGRVQYLGFLDIENVDRTSEAQQAIGLGPTSSMISQGLAGFLRGTLSIHLKDRSVQDIKAFQDAYPAIAGHDIAVATLRKITLAPRVIKPALRDAAAAPEPEVVLLESPASR